MTDHPEATLCGLIGAFIAASSVTAAAIASLFPLSGSHGLVDVLGTFLVVFPFSTAAALVLGFPAFALFNRWRLVRWWSAMLGGAVAGALAILILNSGNVESAAALTLYGAIGSASGLAFWLVWRRSAR